MGDQVHAHGVVDVEPFRMMIHLLDDEGGPRHEAPCFDEVAKAVFAMKLAADDLPAGQALQRALDLLGGQLPRLLAHRELSRRMIRKTKTSPGNARYRHDSAASGARP